MPVNETLIRQTIAAIEAEPDHWDQDAFLSGGGTDPNVSPLRSCGTTMCFAGWAVRLAWGDEAFVSRNFEWASSDPAGTAGWWRYVETAYHSIEDTAASLLGIEDGADVDRIFYCLTNDIEVLKARITEVTGVTFGDEDA